jgi:hypothetical protein
VGEESMKETAAAEINVGGRLRWVATATNELGGPCGFKLMHV